MLEGASGIFLFALGLLLFDFFCLALRSLSHQQQSWLLISTVGAAVALLVAVSKYKLFQVITERRKRCDDDF